MKNKDLRELTVDELRAQFTHFKEELFNLRFQHATGQLENTARIRNVRRSIAQVMTHLHRAERRAEGQGDEGAPPRKRTKRLRRELGRKAAVTSRQRTQTRVEPSVKA